MSGEGLHGAVHVPDDGYLEPDGITRELARRAVARGAEVVTGTRVTGIRLDPRGRVRGVETTAGSIRTECVVNAAGQWAPRVAAMVGVDLPIVPLMHQYLITRPVPGQELPARPRWCAIRRTSCTCARRSADTWSAGSSPTRRPGAWTTCPGSSPSSCSRPSGSCSSRSWRGRPALPGGGEGRDPAARQRADGFTPDGHYALGPVPGRPGLLGGGRDVDQRDRGRGRRRTRDGRVDPRGGPRSTCGS